VSVAQARGRSTVPAERDVDALLSEMNRSSGRLRAQNDQLRRAVALDGSLIAALSAGGGVAELVASAAARIGRPLLVYDLDGKQLAGARIDAELASLVDVDIADRVGEHRSDSVAGTEPASVEIGRACDRRLAVGGYRSVDGAAGLVVLVDQGSPFTILDVHITERIAAAIAVAFPLERRLTSHRSLAEAWFIRSLLDAIDDPAVIEQRAHEVNVDLSERWVAIVIGTDSEPPIDEPTMTELDPLLAGATGAKRLLTARTPDELAVLALIDDPAASEAALTDAIARGIAGRLFVGVSVGNGGAEACVRAMQKARSAARCAAAGATAEIAAASRIPPAQLMIAAPDSTARAALARDLLGGLAEGRDGWARTLFETLATFFECGRSVRRSASRLRVHENTIRNRMESIHRQIGLDILRSADDQLTAQIALTVFAVGRT
jgi:hypothetical protein